jgi:hypothetical protein
MVWMILETFGRYLPGSIPIAAIELYIGGLNKFFGCFRRHVFKLA